MRTEKFFIELIQLSIGVRDALSDCPTNEEWNSLYRMSINQCVASMIFPAFEQMLCNKSIKEKESTLLCNIDDKLFHDWMLHTAIVQVTNKKVNKRCLKVLQNLKKVGLNACILKGQGLASFYGSKALLRQFGDIDVWVDATWKQVMDFVNNITPNREFDRKHTHLNVYRDTAIELHWQPSYSSNPILLKRLSAFYNQQVKSQCSHTVELCDGSGMLNAPDAHFNSIFVLLHIFGHFLYEGVSMKQLMDYYYTLITQDVQAKKDVIINEYKRYGLYDFSRAVMYVMKHVFNVPDSQLLVAPDEKNGIELLRDVLMNGIGEHIDESGNLVKPSFFQRLKIRLYRSLRFIRYNSQGVICMPYNKLSTFWWRRKVIKMYNL